MMTIVVFEWVLAWCHQKSRLWCGRGHCWGHSWRKEMQIHLVHDEPSHDHLGWRESFASDASSATSSPCPSCTWDRIYSCPLSSYLLARPPASCPRPGTSGSGSRDTSCADSYQCDNSYRQHMCTLSCFELSSWRNLYMTRRSRVRSDSRRLYLHTLDRAHRWPPLPSYQVLQGDDASQRRGQLSGVHSSGWVLRASMFPTYCCRIQRGCLVRYRQNRSLKQENMRTDQNGKADWTSSLEDIGRSVSTNTHQRVEVDRRSQTQKGSSSFYEVKNKNKKSRMELVHSSLVTDTPIGGKLTGYGSDSENWQNSENDRRQNGEMMTGRGWSPQRIDSEVQLMPWDLSPTRMSFPLAAQSVSASLCRFLTLHHFLSFFPTIVTSERRVMQLKAERRRLATHLHSLHVGLPMVQATRPPLSPGHEKRKRRERGKRLSKERSLWRERAKVTVTWRERRVPFSTILYIYIVIPPLLPCQRVKERESRSLSPRQSV